MQWKVFAAAAIGGSHLENGTPCQDAFFFREVDNCLVAAVCDGAGSARLSHEGSTLVTRVFVELMAAQSAYWGEEEESFRRLVTGVIDRIRYQITLLAGENATQPTDYAATLVAAVITRTGGWLIHIGDGVAVARMPGDEGETGESILSLPDNGEYANQTWFVTSPDWAAHLRLTRLPAPPELLALMSDGAEPFAMSKGGAGLFPPFIDPVVNYLSTQDEKTGSAALMGTLSDPRTHAITNDDKTLLLALRA